MKKLLAAMLALLMLLTACEAVPSEETDGEANIQISDEDPIEENFEASESGSEEESKEDSKEHLTIKGPVNSDSSESNGSSNRGESGNMKSQVIRANSLSDAGEAFLWQHSVNKKEKGECQVIIFKSEKELRSFTENLKNYYQIEAGKNSLKELLESYDEEFFKENVLVMGHILANSGSVRYSVKNTSVKSGKYLVKMDVEAPEVGTMDMADWFVLVEEPASKIENCLYFALSVKSAANSSNKEWKDR